MSEKSVGGYAFPSEQHETQDGGWNQTFSGGMTLRDWFAGQALTGVIAAGGNLAWDATARIAYGMADAMIEERGKE